MPNLTDQLEDFLKTPLKALETILPHAARVRDVLSFKYDDRPMNEKLYEYHTYWLKLLHDYYFKVEHIGHFDEVEEVAGSRKTILISNHANTLEGPLLCYKFHLHHLGIVHPMVYKEVFRLPIIREIFRSGQTIPISVDAGKEALKKNHIMVFPEGMDFIKHYLKKDFVVKFHKGFLHMAREYMRETGKEEVYVLPVGHEGIDYTIKFWVLNNSFLVEKIIKPYLHYPYFVFPKAPFLFPTRAVFNWGHPRKVTPDELKTEKSLAKLADEFRHEIVKLRGRARAVRKMEKPTDGNGHAE
jgi:1-acyl-sn-glycerol-3-phosphate acyltransferase